MLSAEEEEEVEGATKVEKEEGEGEQSEEGEHKERGSTEHEAGGESAGDRQQREAAEATVGSMRDG